jgi:hypothetical protein
MYFSRGDFDKRILEAHTFLTLAALDADYLMNGQFFGASYSRKREVKDGIRWHYFENT